jgi:hypothetical protein
MIDQIYESTTLIVLLSFFDETGTPVIPKSGTCTYRIDDTQGNAIVPITPFSPTGTTFELEITPLQNVLFSQNDNYETRIVTIVVGYGSTGRKIPQEYRYQLNRLTNYSAGQ